MKRKIALVAWMMASIAFTACQQKSNNATEETATDSIPAAEAVDEVMMPDVTIEKADGTTLQLSSLFGKVLYLDFWATWCPPCCAEIPHLATLHGKFADNPDVRIISVSVDQDRDAWVKKITEDKPAWEQYRVAAEDTEAFFKAINLEFIPRFIIVGADGKILNIEAPRPSEEGSVTAIEQAI